MPTADLIIASGSAVAAFGLVGGAIAKYFARSVRLIVAEEIRPLHQAQDQQRIDTEWLSGSVQVLADRQGVRIPHRPQR